MYRKLILAFLLAFPLVIYIPHLNDFAYPYQSSFSDLTISHFPNALFARDALLQWGQIPLWSNTILSGYPFAANPLAGLWYPPGLIVLVLDLPLAFNITILIHLLIGGLGMFNFLRAEGFEEYPALMGGLAFELLPKLFGHYAAGHVTLIYAVVWTPWLLYFQRKNNSQFATGSILVFGLIILADVRWAAYSGILWGVYSFSLAYSTLKTSRLTFGIRRFLIWTATFFAQFFLAVMIAAPLILPFIEYVSLSTRSLLTDADNLVQSLPPLNLIGLLIPNFGVYAEWLIYPGAFALLMFTWILINSDLRQKYRFWIILLIASLVLALGSNFPGTAWIFSLPGFNMLRVPSRMAFITGIAFAILTAAGFQWWIKSEASTDSLSRKPFGLWLLLPIFVIWTFVFGIWYAQGELPVEFAWGGVAVLAIALLFLLFYQHRINIQTFAFSAILLSFLDLGGVGYSQFNFRSFNDVINEGGEFPALLSDQTGSSRIYTPVYTILPQQRSAYLRLELAEGVDPLQLKEYVYYFNQATGIPATRYSVTLPLLASELGKENFESFVPDMDLLGRLNVGIVILDFNINIPGLLLVEKTDNRYFYENKYVRPRAWVQPDLDISTPYSLVSDINITPNQISVLAEGPGILVLSEIKYPGWNVLVDNMPSEILIVDGLFRAVRIEDGKHEVRFVFQPPLLYLGIILQGIAILIVLGSWVWRRKGAR
jgi:hypothetical protein